MFAGFAFAHWHIGFVRCQSMLTFNYDCASPLIGQLDMLSTIENKDHNCVSYFMVLLQSCCQGICEIVFDVVLTRSTLVVRTRIQACTKRTRFDARVISRNVRISLKKIMLLNFRVVQLRHDLCLPGERAYYIHKFRTMSPSWLCRFQKLGSYDATRHPTNPYCNAINCVRESFLP